MRRDVARVLSVLVAVGLFAAAMIAWGHRTFTAPGPLQESVLATVPKGASLRRISEILEDAGAIDNGAVFRLGARAAGRERHIKSGEYRIPAHVSMKDLLALLVRGDVEQYRVAIPEGMTSHAAVRRLEADERLTGEIAEIPPEGRIAPDTHFFARGELREKVLRRMVEMQDAILAEAWENRRADLPLKTPEELLILASIVQREAGSGEHAKVASVFVNRLERGKRLQADATVRYGLTLGKTKLRRGLRQSELHRKTPYNTYYIDGLPPTPIANPGRAAIEGAANPTETDYLYFVADGTGGHAFAKTYREHQRNVAAWRRIEKARKAGGKRPEKKP